MAVVAVVEHGSCWLTTKKTVFILGNRVRSLSLIQRKGTFHYYPPNNHKNKNTEHCLIKYRPERQFADSNLIFCLTEGCQNESQEH